MALIFCESFGHFGTSDYAQKGWVSEGISAIDQSAADIPHLRGGRAYTVGNTGGGLRKSFGGSAIRIISGSRHYIGSTSGVASGKNLVAAMEGSATVHVAVTLSNAQKWELRRGGAGGTLLATSDVVWETGRWYYVELDVLVDDATGVAIVRVDGSVVASFGPGDTKNGGVGIIDTVAFSHPYSSGSGQYWAFTDVYVADSTGSGVNTTIGDCAVYALAPDGAGAASGWTPSAGVNWQNVDEIPPNGDTDYNSAAAAPTDDLYTFVDLPPATGIVRAVQHVAYVRKDDAGAQTVRPLVRSGVTTQVTGTSQSPSISYAFLRDVDETNPVTGAAWTIAEVNAAQFGERRDS